jgi:ADP-heptose:LPS heptosyltransferase
VARTDVFVSIDTGTMHLAAALGVPTVALFGPTDSAHHGPYGQRGTARVVRSGIACSPCKKPARKACTLNRCLAELEPKQVLAAVEELL